MERMPKNIRQIGGREERMKVYMEDYVSTYLRKLQEEREEPGAVGMLTGERQSDQSPDCVFISGAVEMSGADTEGGRLRLTEAAWTSAYESLGTYFSGQELCGIFVCEGSCRRFRRQALFAAVRESFPDDNEALLYILTEDGEEIFYRITRKGEERLQGYYCYFERNEAMQEYMMDNLRRRQIEKEELPVRRSESCDRPQESWRQAGQIRGSEGTLGDPAESFRERMRRSQEEKSGRKSGRGVFALCAAMAVIVFASGLLLMQKEQGGIQVQDILDRLKINASELLEVSARPEGTTAESTRAAQGGVIVEEIPGNVYPTEENSQPSEVSSEEPDETSTDFQAETSTDAQTETSTDSQTETSAAPASESAAEQSGETESADGSDEMSAAETSVETAASTGVSYVVQAGDSLYSISRRFYGTESMVSRIQEMNNLTNADLIKEGQTLILP